MNKSKHYFPKAEIISCRLSGLIMQNGRGLRWFQLFFKKLNLCRGIAIFSFFSNQRSIESHEVAFDDPVTGL